MCIKKRSKNTGIGPWPHYREQPQNFDRINIKKKKTQKVLDVVLKMREVKCILELIRKIKFSHQLSVP